MFICFRERWSKRTEVALFIPRDWKKKLLHLNVICAIIYNKFWEYYIYSNNKQLESLRDFKLAKISQFVLRKGVWRGRGVNEIVSRKNRKITVLLEVQICLCWEGELNKPPGWPYGRTIVKLIKQGFIKSVLGQ
jgi:hypothetical protein